jgi:Tfp pilus assembly protein PilF
MVLEAKHDLPGAENELKLGLRGAPNDTQATLCLARVYAQTDRAEDAFSTFQTAAGLDRHSPRPLIDAGVVAMQAGRNALAQAFFEKAIERAPKSAEAQARYADVLLARGDKAKAKEHYGLALGGEGTVDREAVQQHLKALK